MITQVSYGRLYNTGNYENVRFEAVVSVEDNGEDATAAAFEEAKAAVHAGYAQWQADREAEEERQRQEREAEMQRRREAAQAKRSFDL